MKRTRILIFHLQIFSIALASYGDIDDRFIECRFGCIYEQCNSNSLRASDLFGHKFPWWTCSDDCSYKCMHMISEGRKQFGLRPLKYYGHWPFSRHFGLEEPASVIFSLLNAVPYLWILSLTMGKMLHPGRSFCKTAKIAYCLDGWLTMSFIIAVNTWLWSAYFHSRKTEFSSLVDYISALIFLSYSLFIAIRRLIGPKPNAFITLPLFSAYLAMLSYRLRSMILGHVSFDDHMKVSITIAVAHVLVWLVWLVFVCEKNAPHRGLCLLVQVWFSCAAMLEIFDFPPYCGVFDAHSLWHACTVPLGYLWILFWQQDREYYCMAQAQLKKGEEEKKRSTSSHSCSGGFARWDNMPALQGP